MTPVFLERYTCVELFRALVCSKTPPDEKDATYFVRVIFQNFTFGTLHHPTYSDGVLNQNSPDSAAKLLSLESGPTAVVL